MSTVTQNPAEAARQRREAEDSLRKRDKEMIPRMLLRAMFILVLASLAIVTYARVTDRPLVAMPPADTPILAERSIILYGDMSGAARVTDPEGRIIATLAEDQGGFVAGIWRVLVRERQSRGVPLDAPIRLVLFADNRLGLRDDHTGWRAELIGFGIDNYRTFLRLLQQAPASAPATGAGVTGD